MLRAGELAQHQAGPRRQLPVGVVEAGVQGVVTHPEPAEEAGGVPPPVADQVRHRVLEHPLRSGRDAPARQVQRQRQVTAGVGEEQAGPRFDTDPVAAQQPGQHFHRLVPLQDGHAYPAYPVQAEQPGAAGDEDAALGRGRQQVPYLVLVAHVVEYDEQPAAVEEGPVEPDALTRVGGDAAGGDAQRLQEAARDPGGVAVSAGGRVQVRVELSVGQVRRQFTGQAQREGRLAGTDLTADHQRCHLVLSAGGPVGQGSGLPEQGRPSHQGVRLHRELGRRREHGAHVGGAQFVLVVRLHGLGRGAGGAVVATGARRLVPAPLPAGTVPAAGFGEGEGDLEGREAVSGRRLGEDRRGEHGTGGHLAVAGAARRGPQHAQFPGERGDGSGVGGQWPLRSSHTRLLHNSLCPQPCRACRELSARVFPIRYRMLTACWRHHL